MIDGKVHLFYQTYGNGKNDAICHAISSDGISFTRDATNPVFHPEGPWTCGRAIDAEVIKFKGKYYLYYATRDPGYKIQMQGVAMAPVTATSAETAGRTFLSMNQCLSLNLHGKKIV